MSDPGDQAFGRSAADKQEAADEMAEQGRDPSEALEGPGADPRPRAANKASEGAPPQAGGVGPDEESEESFPASDPPGDY